jgi:mannitol-1-phosphate 5-dehydrogenase
MKKAVQFGAGSIGRGFIGELLSRSGYEVVFVDVDPAIVEAMNAARRYPVRVVGDGGDSESYVDRVRAVSAADAEAVARELCGADVAGTAVGAGALSKIAPLVAAGLELRWRQEIKAPLNFILCENLVDADSYFRGLVSARLDVAGKESLGRLVGFVRASVGRMVPVMTDAMREGNPLRVWVEAYDHLQVDDAAFAGRPPEIVNVERVAPFELYVRRKLYIHNMGHASAAYLGALRGYRFIWEAVGDAEVAEAIRVAMRESAAAVAAEDEADESLLLEHAEDLLARFANRKLGDTIERVGRDLPRKLAPRDRLAGAVALCAKHGLPRAGIERALAAALLFEDSSSSAVRDKVEAEGPRAALEAFCGFGPGDPDAEAIAVFFEDLKRRRA